MSRPETMTIIFTIWQAATEPPVSRFAEGGDPDHHRGGVRRVRDWRVPVVGGYPIAGWLISNRNSHRSKWMMTGGSPVTKPKPPYDRR